MPRAHAREHIEKVDLSLIRMSDLETFGQVHGRQYHRSARLTRPLLARGRALSTRPTPITTPGRASTSRRVMRGG